MTMIDMSRKENNSSPCCDIYNPKYSIGFFLNPEQVKALGLVGIEPEQEIKIEATLIIGSVTERKDECECYVHVKEMGVMSGATKNDSKILMSRAYEGKKDVE